MDSWLFTVHTGTYVFGSQTNQELLESMCLVTMFIKLSTLRLQPHFIPIAGCVSTIGTNRIDDTVISLKKGACKFLKLRDIAHKE